MNIVSRLTHKCVCTVTFKHAYKVHIYIYIHIHYGSVVSLHTMLSSPEKISRTICTSEEETDKIELFLDSMLRSEHFKKYRCFHYKKWF